MLENPRIIDTTARDVAVIRFTIPRADMPKIMRPAIEELVGVLQTQGIGPAGPMFDRHLSPPSTIFDVEVGFPVTAKVVATGRVVPSTLPATTNVACATYVGPYEGLPNAWGEFEAWYRARGRTPGTTLWQIYVRGPESGGAPETFRTELYRPLVG